MTPRILPERTRPLVPALQATRNCALVLIIGFTVIILVNADPNHHYAQALISSARTWLHAAFNL